MTKTAYGMIMCNIPKRSQASSWCMNEQHIMKNCYTRYKRNANDKGDQEEKDTKLTQEKEYGLNLSNLSKSYIKPIKKTKMDRRFWSYFPYYP